MKNMTKLFYKNCYAVVGLGFGDEGKGLVTNSLSSSLNNSIIVRYSGGQQAGHTVVLKNGIRHVFSNFGSGTFNNSPTYWSEFCTFDPIGFFNEYNILKSLGYDPIIFINKKSPITTYYDKIENKLSSKYISNGTCGCGVGTTFEREDNNFSLLIEDIQYKEIFSIKLNLIKKYYESLNYLIKEKDLYIENESLIYCCDTIKNNKNFIFVDDIPGNFDNYIFEGSQGLLLDQNIGFFPHVTRSNTGSKNIQKICNLPCKYFLVTRAFQTRHGNGPMSNIKIDLKTNKNETNIYNSFQGNFRKSVLNLDFLKYAIEKDNIIKNSEKELIITCMDLLNEYKYIKNNNIIEHLNEENFVNGISEYLEINKIHLAKSPSEALILS